MLKSFEKESYKEIIKNMEYVNSNLGVGDKFKRRMPEMTQEEYSVYMKKHSEAKFDILKCECQLVKMIRKMNAGTLDTQEYPFVGDQPKRRVVVGGGGATKQSKFQDSSNLPRLFTYVIGGLSHNEIVEIDLL